MTREEAIAILKDISWQMGSVKRWENIEAIDMAIEALKAEPVRCKDCKHRFYDESNEAYMCDRHEYGESFGDDDFCSYAERGEP